MAGPIQFFAQQRLPPEARRYIEDHAQTAQKLAAYRAYVGAWGNIIANAHTNAFTSRHVFLVDTHAGAGYNASREHPDGAVPGTPLIACHEARRLQRRYPRLQVHVRLVEINPKWVMLLRQELDSFVRPLVPTERVDVTLAQADFADQVQTIVDEIEQYRAASLWMIDPYGIKLPLESLAPLQWSRSGRPEVLINLDLLGMWRVNGAVSRANERAGELIMSDYRVQETLNGLFGCRAAWESALNPAKTFSENVPSMADAYAGLFTGFTFRRSHRMLANRGQARAIIHLSHHQVAANKFARVFESSQDIGLLAGRRLDHASRSHAAKRYWEMYRAQTTTVQRLFQEGLLPHDKSQIRWVLSTADEEGYGRYDEKAGIMVWSLTRNSAPPDEHQASLFPSL